MDIWIKVDLFYQLVNKMHNQMEMKCTQMLAVIYTNTGCLGYDAEPT